METSAEGGRPRGIVVLFGDRPVREVTFQSEDGAGWRRQVKTRGRPIARSQREYFSTCLESRAAFNLIWVYLHKSPLNLNVRDPDALSRKDRTHGRAQLPKKFPSALRLSEGKRRERGKVRRQLGGKKPQGNFPLQDEEPG